VVMRYLRVVSIGSRMIKCDVEVESNLKKFQVSKLRRKKFSIGISLDKNFADII